MRLKNIREKQYISATTVPNPLREHYHKTENTVLESA
jgi:hypothetical protein